MTHFRDFTLIFHPRILKHYDVYFNKGWTIGPINSSILLSKDDNDDILKRKITEIREFIKNPDLPIKIKDTSSFYHHELIFSESISLDGNLLAIVCNGCSDDVIKKIRKIIHRKNYKDVKIITKNYPFPTLSELER